MTTMRMIPQIAMVRKALTPRRLSPLETICKMIKAITSPETLPKPPREEPQGGRDSWPYEAQDGRMFYLTEHRDGQGGKII